MQNTCPQCKNTLKTPSCRLIQDTCGHQKCRLCLLKDEDKCGLCIEPDNSPVHNSVIKYENNHTAVIAFKGSNDVNGNSNGKNGVISSNVKGQDKSEGNKHFYQTLPIPNHITVTSEVPIIYTCKICGRQFKTRSHIRYHQYCVSGMYKSKFI